MTITAEIKNNIVVPLSIQKKAGIKHGDRLAFNVSGRIITIKPESPKIDAEYTSQQRKVIDAGIKKGLEDVKKGRFYGPFETHQDMVTFLSEQKRKYDQKIKSKK